MKRTPIHFSAALSLLLALGAATTHAGDLYRYKNADGVTVINDTIPPEAVVNGYEVVNRKGVVLQVVPAQLSPEEQKEADALREKEEQLRQWDESLLRRYSSIEDIEAERDRALRDLRIRVSILKGNKRSLKQQVENYQAQAAEMERRGQSVDPKLLSTIKDLQGEIAVTDKSISERLKEVGAREAEFNADIERFSLLQDKVEFRRQASAGQGSTR